MRNFDVGRNYVYERKLMLFLLVVGLFYVPLRGGATGDLVASYVCKQEKEIEKSSERLTM